MSLAGDGEREMERERKRERGRDGEERRNREPGKPGNVVQTETHFLPLINKQQQAFRYRLWLSNEEESVTTTLYLCLHVLLFTISPLHIGCLCSTVWFKQDGPDVGTAGLNIYTRCWCFLNKQINQYLLMSEIGTATVIWFH